MIITIVILSGCSSEESSNKPRLFNNQGTQGDHVLCIIDIGPINDAIFNNLISEERLPNIQKFISRGQKYKLSDSTRYFDNAVIYSEFLTGINSEDNGIATSWWGTDNVTRYASSGSGDLSTTPLWEKFSQNRINSLFINIPLTYPAPQTDAVVISENFLICANDGINPPELRDYLRINGVVPDIEGLDFQIKDLLSPKTVIAKADIEALNRFINFPLSERNFDDLLKDNIDPGSEYLEYCLRLLAWELRKDRTMLEMLTLLDESYPPPDFIAIRSGVLEIALKCFIRFHYAQGFNIRPFEMEVFGDVVERCFEYEDDLIGRVGEILSGNRDIILFAGYQIEPSSLWWDSLKDGSMNSAILYRGHPVGIRLNPSDLANELNSALRSKHDVILKPPQSWPLYSLHQSNLSFEYQLLPESSGYRKINKISELLSNCSDEFGNKLFSEVKLLHGKEKKILLTPRNGIKPSDLFDADGFIIDAKDFITAVPQISGFSKPGGMAIISPKNGKTPERIEIKSTSDLHYLVLSLLEIQSDPHIFYNTVIDSTGNILNIPEEKPCDSELEYCLKALGYL
ncbi:MAG: hypothetical protein GY855_07370 [candidate division Zixibacteria bacterium]|nr:hypothetical protein [candidate division Zixibacteria bacterium]